MPQGSFKKRPIEGQKTQRRTKALKTKKGRVVKAPKRKAAQKQLALETAVHKMVGQKTEEKTRAMVAHEGSRLKILQTPPVMAPKKKKR